MDNRLNNVSENITPICISSKTPRDMMRVDSNDEEKLLKVCLNEMKKKLHFIDKTNWMFKNNFDPQFLETIDPKIIDEQTNIFSMENNLNR